MAEIKWTWACEHARDECADIVAAARCTKCFVEAEVDAGLGHALKKWLRKDYGENYIEELETLATVGKWEQYAEFLDKLVELLKGY